MPRRTEGYKNDVSLLGKRRKYDPSLPLAFKIARLFGQPIEDVFRCDDGDGS